ncbi:NAD(P)/FAD-dependent oxidoreductase [Pseudomonas putida]
MSSCRAQITASIFEFRRAITMKNADVVIIGAGISGLATGYWLAKAGMSVIVLEKGRMVGEASSRATGYLSLRADQPAENPLAMAAEQMWATLDEELGYPTEWTPKGRLWCAVDERDWTELQALREAFKRTTVPFEMIDGAACQGLVPPLTGEAMGGLYTHHSGHANPQRTSQAFGWAFQDRGGLVLEHTPALGVVVEGGKVKGVKTAEGIIYCDTVVCSAGPQSRLICEPLGIQLPIASVRVEAAITTPLPPLFDIAFIGHGLSVRQTKRGNLHFNGGPPEWVGVDLTCEPPKPSTASVRSMAKRLARLFPNLRETTILRSWSGIVDVTPDHASILERLTSPDGLIVISASGHGFGMGVAVGQAAADLAMHGKSSIPIDGLKLSRFAALPKDWQTQLRWQPGDYNT